MLLALQRFGFCDELVNMIGRMHDETTAQFLVNGEISKKRVMASGIRHGCPLAPLLFIIAAEVLALAVNQTPSIKGIRLDGSTTVNKFSAFLDDSAVFVSRGAEVKPLVTLLHRFSKLSGLKVQLARSWYISLNKIASQVAVHGIHQV